jgi:aspartate/methionine/tyrosine aminotransferase
MSESTPPVDPRFNDVFSALPTTIFETMSRLAMEHKSINLGQGFPDNELEGPSSMKDIVYKSMTEENACNQYPPLMGVPALRQAIAQQSSSLLNAAVTADNVLVTLGATEALASSFLGLLNPGDEVIVFAPMYDSYIPMIRRAGAIPVVVNLCPPRWEFDILALNSAFTPKTKLIVVNSPHNPTGKVFTREELTIIADILSRQRGLPGDLQALKIEPDPFGCGNGIREGWRKTLCLCDEVYENHVYPGKEHVSLAQINDQIRDQCIRIGSAGKTFSFTDFKIGWISSTNKHLVQAVAKAHQFLAFTVNSALQKAVAYGFEHENGEFYRGLGAILYKKRCLVEERLKKIGFEVLPSDATYFLIADIKALPLSEYDDVEFCTQMTIDPGVTLIPVSAFYENRQEAPKTLVRFVLCKTDEKLNAACDALEKFFLK